jgi:hypothetical protein
VGRYLAGLAAGTADTVIRVPVAKLIAFTLAKAETVALALALAR